MPQGDSAAQRIDPTGSAPVSAIQASGTGAKASFTSNTPTSDSATPALASTFRSPGWAR